MSASQDGGEDEGLPLRWVVILLISGLAGLVVGQKEGVGAGATVAIALAGLLHMIVRR